MFSVPIFVQLSLFAIPIFHFIMPSFKKVMWTNFVRMIQTTYQWHDFWLWGHVTNEKCHIATFTNATITKVGENVYQNERYSYMSLDEVRDHVTFKSFAAQLSRRVQLPSFLGIHTRMKRYYSLISRDLVTLTLRRWKVLISTGHVIFHFMVSWWMKSIIS